MSTSRGPDRRPAPPAGERRRARERALELLYEAESKAISPTELLADLPVEPEPYAVELVAGVAGRSSEIDDVIGRHASGWTVERMPAVDRCVLKVATYELLCEPGVPVAVVIDEAIELVKAYSTEDSGGYVNGVLSAVAAEVRPAKVAEGA